MSVYNVFRTYFLVACKYSFDIWYVALSYQVTDQVRIWSRSIDFSRSYGPWTQKNFMNYQFSALFSQVLADIHLIFGMWLCHTKIQIKFKFSIGALIYVTGRGHCIALQYSQNACFRDASVHSTSLADRFLALCSLSCIKTKESSFFLMPGPSLGLLAS